MESKYQVTYKLSDDRKPFTNEDTFQESAASLTEIEPYKYGKNSSKFDRERKKRWSKIFLTGLSAILIGTGFGLLLLFIFSYDEDTSVMEQAKSHPVKEETPSDLSSQANPEVELGDLSGYVIQAGAFQSMEQAELSQEILTSQGYPTVIWSTDTDYRVFLAIYQSEEEAKQMGIELADKGLDVYVREWQTDTGKIKLASEEKDWLIEFETLWQQSLSGYSTELDQAWQNWLTIDQEKLSAPSQQFRQSVDLQLEEMTNDQLAYDLLVLLNDYHQMIIGTD
ncbi:SPOR domain-containing protein [Amphibacillus sp. MSJ-3]|uniref:SPOR domain-containing protein n=1 Tax=Amphibacillus sp. MSJ-3 TaxID=2841505 RepID=UPI001C0F3139|nr:SPOR domain-containing protein [Amphibacillus sp. MSJ-3]MBU5593602.1 SPOR domain-containing protein [Amphibacillus sp. MSJ-3]